MKKIFSQVKLSRNESKNLKKLYYHYNLKRILTKSGITKLRGIEIFTLINLMLIMILENSNSIYQGIFKNGFTSYKSTLNNMLNNPNYNWRRYLYSVSKIFIRKCYNADSDIGCLIIDDTCKEKTGHKVQWLSWFFDHSTNNYFKGFQNILCAFSNGRTAIPLDFEYKIGKAKTKHYTKSNYEKGSHAEQRVRFAMQKKSTITMQMIKRAFQRNIQFKYILWDSWYNSSSAMRFISKVINSKGVHLISMLKRGSTKYRYRGSHYSLKELNQKAGKWTKDRKTGIKSKSIIVEYLDASQKLSMDKRPAILKVKISFFKYQGVKKWKAILSTDLELTSEEILRLYLRRWSIECIFKELKQYFGYDQCKSSKYAAMVSDFTIRCSFYIMFCHIREIENQKTMYQVLCEFYEELFDEWLDNYIKRILVRHIEDVARFAQRRGIRTIDEFINKIDNIMESFFEEEFYPDKFIEKDKYPKRKIA